VSYVKFLNHVNLERKVKSCSETYPANLVNPFKDQDFLYKVVLNKSIHFLISYLSNRMI